MVDGVIARRTDSTSKAGTRLDSIADIVCIAATFAAVQEGHIIRTGKIEEFITGKKLKEIF